MAGYSGTPLAQKLGLKAGHALVTIGAPADYRALIGTIANDLVIGTRISAKADVVHLFTARRTELDRLLSDCRSTLKPTATVWVSWPKKASKVASEVTEDLVREVALPLGFVDVKVCAVSDVWSGLKLVVRTELR